MTGWARLGDRIKALSAHKIHPEAARLQSVTLYAGCYCQATAGIDLSAFTAAHQYVQDVPARRVDSREGSNLSYDVRDRYPITGTTKEPEPWRTEIRILAVRDTPAYFDNLALLVRTVRNWCIAEPRIPNHSQRSRIAPASSYAAHLTILLGSRLSRRDKRVLTRLDQVSVALIVKFAHKVAFICTFCHVTRNVRERTAVEQGHSMVCDASSTLCHHSLPASASASLSESQPSPKCNLLHLHTSYISRQPFFLSPLLLYPAIVPRRIHPWAARRMEFRIPASIYFRHLLDLFCSCHIITLSWQHQDLLGRLFCLSFLLVPVITSMTDNALFVPL